MSRLILISSIVGAALFTSGASGLALGDRHEEMAAPSPQGTHILSDGRAKRATPELQAPDLRVVLLEGDRIADVLLRAKVGAYDASKAATALGDVTILPGRRISLWLGGTLVGGARGLIRMEVRGTGHLIHSVELEGDEYTAKVVSREIDDTPVRFTLETGPALMPMLAAAGVPSDHRSSIERAIEGSGEGRVDLLVAHEEIGATHDFGPLLHLSLNTRGGTERHWLGDGKGGLTALDTHEGGMVKPVSGRVTSAPGLRVHPVLRFLRWHRGTDFAVPNGTPVLAAMDGVVESSGWNGGYGKLVRLRHADGSTTAYAHLSEIDVATGGSVNRGEVLGRVGETGLTTGPHLHFEWLRDGQVLHPTFARPGNVTLAHDASTRNRLHRLLAAPYRPAPPRG